MAVKGFVGRNLLNEPEDVSALLSAARSGDADGIGEALASGTDINAVNRKGETAILAAAKAGQIGAVHVLLARGADIDLQDETCLNPLLWGAISGDCELVRVAVEAGADLNLLTRFGGNALTPAAEKGNIEVVAYLLAETNINVNLTNTLGWTALIEAIILGDGGPTQQEIVRLLLAGGADPLMTDERGRTPQFLAQDLGYGTIAADLRAATYTSA